MSKELTVRDQPFNTRNVVTTLEKLMNRVTEKDCNPNTVIAACQCAEKITDILKVHLEVAKLERTRKQEE